MRCVPIQIFLFVMTSKMPDKDIEYDFVHDACAAVQLVDDDEEVVDIEDDPFYGEEDNWVTSRFDSISNLYFEIIDNSVLSPLCRRLTVPKLAEYLYASSVDALFRSRDFGEEEIQQALRETKEYSAGARDSKMCYDTWIRTYSDEIAEMHRLCASYGFQVHELPRFLYAIR